MNIIGMRTKRVCTRSGVCYHLVVEAVNTVLNVHRAALARLLSFQPALCLVLQTLLPISPCTLLAKAVASTVPLRMVVDFSSKVYTIMQHCLPGHFRSSLGN